MSSKKSSSIITMVLLSAAALFADPILIAGWNWVDAEGVFHEYAAYDFPCRSWDISNDQIDGTWYPATITSSEEQDALIAGLRGIQGEYWLGGYQTGRGTDPADNWAWVTGETWDYKNWAPGEPNDAYGKASEQHLAVWSAWGTERWLWNDEGYLPNIKGYIAETSHSVPEPTMLSLCFAGFLAIGCMAGKRKV